MIKHLVTIPPYKIFTVLALSFLVGIGLGSYLNLEWQSSWYILLFLVVVLLLISLINFYFHNQILVLASWSAIILLVGFSWYIFFNQKSNINLPYDQNIIAEGTVVKPPAEDPLKQKIIIQTQNLEQNSRIIVNGPHYPSLMYGDKVRIKGKLEKAGIIEDFDYGGYLKRYLVFGVIYQPTSVEKIGQENQIDVTILKSIYQIPNMLESGINSYTPEPQASLAGGILFGTKKNMPENFQDALSKTGLTHIIALSGYNVTIIITALAVILSSYFGRKKTFLIGVLAVLGFVLMTGAASSVVRAAIFSLLILFGRLIGRQGNHTNLMLLAAVIMVAINPYVLRFDIGFQLSFSAFAGLIYLSPLAEKILDRSYIKHLPVYIKSPLVQTLSAQIMVLPLIVIYFGRLSIISPVANLLVLWVVPLAMLVSLISAFGGLIWWPIAKLTYFLAWPVLTYIVAVTEWLAKIPLASIELKNLNWIIALAGYSLILFIAIITNRRLHKLVY